MTDNQLTGYQSYEVLKISSVSGEGPTSSVTSTLRAS